MDAIRFGYVSRIDYETGMIAVAYPDRDESVTRLIPYLQLGGEYHMPKIEQRVAVAHLSTGLEVAVCLGTFWGPGDTPPVYGKDIFHKELSNTAGAAYMHHDPETGVLTIKAGDIRLLTDAGEVSVSDIIGG